jgi:hypothetical protein
VSHVGELSLFERGSHPSQAARTLLDSAGFAA